MCPNPQFPVDLVTLTGEILNGKLHFLCSVYFIVFDSYCSDEYLFNNFFFFCFFPTSRVIIKKGYILTKFTEFNHTEAKYTHKILQKL